MKAGFELYLGKKIINVACFILIKHWRVVFAEGLKYNKTVILAINNVLNHMFI